MRSTTDHRRCFRAGHGASHQRGLCQNRRRPADDQRRHEWSHRAGRRAGRGGRGQGHHPSANPDPDSRLRAGVPEPTGRHHWHQSLGRFQQRDAQDRGRRNAVPDQGAQRHQLGRCHRAGHQEHGHHGRGQAAAGCQRGHGLRAAGGCRHRQLHPERARARDLAAESAHRPGATHSGDERHRHHRLWPERPLGREGQAEHQGRRFGRAADHLRPGRSEALRSGRRRPEGPAGFPGPGLAERRRHRENDVGRRGAPDFGLWKIDGGTLGRLQEAASEGGGLGKAQEA